MNVTPINAVPSNIITGFLGVGKTSAILNLLRQKPGNERWAVLVNEFGEIGVDGSLLQGNHPEATGVYVREVPGGCMCCTAGLPMQIALNQLLARARPDRLLIEPSGLGHPLEVLQSLSAEHYRDVLAPQKTVTLVDARKLDDPRYTGHDTFNQQIAIADVVVGNKLDLYGPGDQRRLETYVQNVAGAAVEVHFTRQAALQPAWLVGPSAVVSGSHHLHHHPDHDGRVPDDSPIPETGYLTATNSGEGYESIGWRFAPTRVFDHQRLFTFLCGLEAERMKAVFITQRGIFGYNLTSDSLTELPLDETLESRIEIIAPSLDPSWEQQLMACLLGDG